MGLLSGRIIALSGSSLILIIPLFIVGLSLSVSNSISAALSQLTIAIPITRLIGIIGWLILGRICNILIAAVFLFDKSFLFYSVRKNGR